MILELKKPYVLHFMDNQFSVRGRGLFDRISQKRLKMFISLLVYAAEKVFVITAAMGRHYEQIFGKPCEVFQASFQPSGLNFNSTSIARNRIVFSIVYVGSVENYQIEALKDVVIALTKLQTEMTPIKLTLYLTEETELKIRSFLVDANFVDFRRHPRSDELEATLALADLLVLFYSFDYDALNYYRYSFPTKLIPYMYSGKCILAYGPNEIEPIRYVQQNGLAFVVSERDPVILSRAISLLAENTCVRASFARRALRFAQVNHNHGENAKRFLNSLREVAERS
jgi:glycosyltransferase involved in cell wall biosynthesis